MKDSGLRIRIERELREKFLALCREQDRPAAQVIREFMRAYINENEKDSGPKAKRKQA
jgi:predicted DNA-binding protein